MDEHQWTYDSSMYEEFDMDLEDGVVVVVGLEIEECCCCCVGSVGVGVF